MSDFSFNVIWSKYYIGIAIDKKISKFNLTIPITSYYFWPRFDSWYLLRNQLNLIPWLSKIERIKILNGYTKLLNLWQLKNGSLTTLSKEQLLKLQREFNFTLIAVE